MTSTVLIDSGYFYCAVVVRDKVVIEAAPIVRYMKGWSSLRVRDYCKSKGWKYGKIIGDLGE